MTTIRRQILALAIPSIIANITTPLLGLVDLAIVGHLGDAVYIGAIALGGTIFSMIYWIFGFLRMGTSGVTAQSVGAGDTRERDAWLYRSMGVALLIGLALIALRRPLSELMLRFMGSDVATTAQARIYFDILIYGAPATMGLYAVNGWFIGVQNSRLAMWTSLTINVVNITASLVLVYGAGMKVAGVAYGSFIAQWTGVIVAMALCRGYRPRLGRWEDVTYWGKLKRFFKVNNDIFWRTLCLVAVTVCFTQGGARQGGLILAANALLMQFFIFDSYIMDGFAFAAEAMVGRFTGEGNHTDKWLTIKAIFRVGIVISIVLSISYAAGVDVAMSLLSDNSEVVAVAHDYKWWVVAIPFAGIGAFVWDGVYVGETLTRRMLVSMAGATALFFGVWIGLKPVMGNHALWLAFTLYLAMRGALQTVLYPTSRG